MPPISSRIAGRGRHFAIPDQFRCAGNRRGQAGHDTSQDDHGNTVADAALGDLFAEPHQEHRSCHQRNAGRNEERRPRRNDDARLALQPGSSGYRLEGRERNRSVARVLDNLAASRFALFAELLQRLYEMAGHLHDDRRGDVRHDAEREDAETRERAGQRTG